MDLPIGAVDQVLAASRALVGVAANSIAVLGDDVTLEQFRALVLVADGRVGGPGDLAVALDVHPSNATRIVDRMVAKGLLQRLAASDDRRTVPLVLGRAGRAVLRKVNERREREIARILSQMSDGLAAEVAAALGEFASAAGETADEAWRLGWGT